MNKNRVASALMALRHFAMRVLQIVAIFIVIGIPLILLFTRVHGLGKDVKKRVESALSGEFYNVKVHRLLFSISEGLIAENLRVEEKSSTHRLLVHANRITILPKLSALSRGHLEIDSFQLRHATIDVPLEKTEEPRLRLDHVEATIICPPGQLTLSNTKFDLCGITVHASGNFLNPKTFAPKPLPTGGPGKIAQTIELVQKELQLIHWKGRPPSLSIEASGDLTKLESLKVDHVMFTSGPCSYRTWHLNRIEADLEYTDFLLQLRRLMLQDSLGELYVLGKADFRKKEAAINFSGECDLSGALENFFSTSLLADCQWIDVPHSEGSASVNWKNNPPLLQSEMHLDAGKFVYHGVMMKSLSGGCIFEGNRFLARDIVLNGDPGALTLDIMGVPNDYRIRIKGDLFPQFLEPAVTGKLKEALSVMNFQDPLEINFEGRGATPNPLFMEGTGSMKIGRATMRGASIDHLEASLSFKDEMFDFQNILATVGQTKAQGECIYDIKNKELRFPGIIGNLDPVNIMMWIDPRIADSLKDYRFRETPNIKVTGTIGLKDPEKNDFYIDIKAPAGLDYTLIKRDLFFNHTAATAAIKKQELFVDVAHASLFGGDVSLNARISVVPGSGHYGADAHLEGVDFQKLTKLYFDYDTSEGKLSGNYSFTTVTGDDYAMTGRGNLLVKDGNVLAMPVFGPLSVLMNDISPGLGYQAARRATADFTVQKGIINTKNLSIQSMAFSMIGSGDIYYLEDRMNMNMRLNIQGLPGVVLFPVSKLFEYISDGSAKHPTWRAKYVPKIMK
jgi:hypothetical protein